MCVIIFCRYYEGAVSAYDHVNGKHKVLYDDGVEEQINLKKHRWELADVNVSPDKVSTKLIIFIKLLLYTQMYISHILILPGASNMKVYNLALSCISLCAGQKKT